MGENSSIEWCRHSWNPWRGCVEVSPGCAFCYAREWAKRNPAVFGTWGQKGIGTRVVASETMWKNPVKWDKEAAKAGERHRVFCASMADVFEDWQGVMKDSKGETLYQVNLDKWPGSGGGLAWEPNPEIKIGRDRHMLTMDDVRRRLARLIWDTQNLDWLLLTKRIENAKEMIYRMWFPDAAWPKNYWLGTTVENQEQADKRIPILLSIPAKVRFLSVEPMLGPIDLSPYLQSWHRSRCPWKSNCNWAGPECPQCGHPSGKVDWVIVGGESGPKARPFNLDWARSIRDQCKASGTAFFMKQCGANVGGGWSPGGYGPHHLLRDRWKLKDSHGGDESEWPADLQGCRAFPKVEVGR